MTDTWKPEDVLRADATDEQIYRREAHVREEQWKSGPDNAFVTVAREFASACVAAVEKERDRWREQAAKVERMLAASREQETPVARDEAMEKTMNEAAQWLQNFLDDGRYADHPEFRADILVIISQLDSAVAACAARRDPPDAAQHRDILLRAVMLVLDRWTYSGDREQVRQDCRVELEDAWNAVTNDMLSRFTLPPDAAPEETHTQETP